MVSASSSDYTWCVELLCRCKREDAPPAKYDIIVVSRKTGRLFDAPLSWTLRSTHFHRWDPGPLRRLVRPYHRDSARLARQFVPRVPRRRQVCATELKCGSETSRMGADGSFEMRNTELMGGLGSRSRLGSATSDLYIPTEIPITISLSGKRCRGRKVSLTSEGSAAVVEGISPSDVLLLD